MTDNVACSVTGKAFHCGGEFPQSFLRVRISVKSLAFVLALGGDRRMLERRLKFCMRTGWLASMRKGWMAVQILAISR